MALNSYTPVYTGTGPTLAQPTTSETISFPDGKDCWLMVSIGGTSTNVTITTHDVDIHGQVIPDNAMGFQTSTVRFFRIPVTSQDPTTGTVTVTFTQVTAVTAAIIRLP